MAYMQDRKSAFIICYSRKTKEYDEQNSTAKKIKHPE